MDSLHIEAIKLNPDIILFPETALPTHIRLNKKVRDLLQNRVDRPADTNSNWHCG